MVIKHLKPSKNKKGRPTTLPEPWLTLATRIGNGEPDIPGLLRKLHTARTNLYQWARGLREPNTSAKVIILQLFKEYGVEPPEGLECEPSIAKGIILRAFKAYDVEPPEGLE